MHQYFHNYAVHHLWRSPFTDAPRLLAYVFRLVLRAGLLRLTLAGNPGVATPCEEPSPAAKSWEKLDRTVVETFQLVARHVEQAPNVL